MILLSSFLLPLYGEETSAEENLEHKNIDEEYAQRDPIRIDSDERFHEKAEAWNWPGNGTNEDPYIISGYSIDGSGYGFCIYIGNTTVHFELKNNHFYDADGGKGGEYYFQNRGIFLNNVRNAMVTNNLISDNGDMGIALFGCRENTIRDNNIINNGWTGLYAYHSSQNSFESNNFSDNNRAGIRLLEANKNELRDNNITGNPRDGISLGGSEENLIVDNNISYNNQCGLGISTSTQNIIKENRISNNKETGARLRDSEENLLYKNKFIENENQAYDDGNNDWDAGNPEWDGDGGNYWSDYQGDNRGDNIGDEIYEIEGNTNQDNYPWTNINMVHPVENFQIGVNNITASNRPTLRITKGYDIHENPLEGSYEGEIVIEDSIIKDYFKFSEGITEYVLKEINVTRKYDISVTIDGITEYDCFQVKPLQVDGNTEMVQMAEKEDWSGTGSQNDPFMIEGYNIKNLEENYSVYFSNLTLHFVFKDNTIDIHDVNERKSASNIGIYIYNVENAEIYKNVISNHDLGLNLTLSSNNYIIENQIKNNERKGGLSFYESNSNYINNNLISNNEGWGIHLMQSEDNLIYRNNFIENKYQAYDDSENYWNDEDPKNQGVGGNYWSNYQGENRGDGIGKEPYNISGSQNQDDYPWITSERGKINFEVKVCDVQAGDKPRLNITRGLDQYQNKLEGEYKVEVIVEKRNIIKNVTFIEGDGELFIDEITRADFYEIKIIIYDVIKSSESVNFEVKPSTVDTIGISPTDDQVITAGNHLHFSAEAVDEYGNLITDIDSDFTWNNTDRNGVFLITTSGNYEVTAEYNGISVKVTVTVEPGDPYLLEILPSDDTIMEGESVSFVSILYDRYDNKIREVTNETEWEISDGAGGEWNENEYTSEKIGVWAVRGEFNGLENTVSIRVKEDIFSNFLILALFFSVVVFAVLILNKYL